MSPKSGTTDAPSSVLLFAVSGDVSPRRGGMALTAEPPSALARLVGVAKRAMRLRNEKGTRLAAQHVDAMGHGFKMGRSDAGRNATEMVEFGSFGSRAEAPLMGVHRVTATNIESAVAMRQRSRPKPALAEVGSVRRNRPALVDFAPKADSRVFGEDTAGDGISGHRAQFISVTARNEA